MGWQTGDCLQIHLHHNIERPAATEPVVGPVQGGLMMPVVTLYDSAPDPSSTEQRHDEYI